MSIEQRGAVAGAAGAAVSVGVAELLAGVLSGAPSPIVEVGAAVIDLQPAGAKDLMVALFGTADKLAFELMIVAVALAIGALVGRMALRRRWIVPVAFLAFAAVAVVASLRDPLVSALLAPVTLLVSAAAGIVTVRALLGAAGGPSDATGVHGAGVDRSVARDGVAEAAPGPASPSRRRFVALGGSALGAAAVAGLGGRVLTDRRPPLRPAAPLPAPNETAPAIPIGAAFAVPGLTPIVVANDDFYRIDTRLTIPRIDADTWRLRIHGMVDREVTLTYAQLAAMPLVERYVTIACVSNEVGGDLVGNAKWTGVPLQDVLDLAGVQPGASQIVGRAFDGWTAGFPTAFGGTDGREGLVALKMNDETLPAPHGYPARLIIPGLYGYVSATKWLTEIELTTLEAFDAYWIPLGWSKEGPIKTQSRIDVPRDGSSVPIGPTAVAGVAWAPDRGIAGVEVSIDDGPWQPATLATAISSDTWVQWRMDWNPAAGAHTIRARATDGTGTPQTAEVRPPAPDGASGYHTIRVTTG